ncbi:MAG TPA: 4-vinyl reductase [Gemmatimonadales bacterium]|nr:4-vinyl reductase [Gemmatimonadales bacterium]
MSRPAAGLLLGRRALQQLRASLERDAGLQAATYLQEAGFASGEEMYQAFAAWLAEHYEVPRPADLDVRYLGEALGGFFRDMGWGELATEPLGPAVLALDAPAWAEALDEGGAAYPTCHLSCGMLADLLGRVAEGLVAVMEVECRSRGDARCRFLAGAPETLGTLYEQMARGVDYREAVEGGR